MKTFPQAPYFDDFSADKNFLKVLFQPGYAVQTRELNQAQTILQKQIESFGNHIFKEGAMVIPGHVSYENNVDCIKLQSTNSSSNKVSSFLSSFLNKTIIGSVSGVHARVIHVEPETATDPNTLYVRYIVSAGISGTFSDNEIIYTDDTVPFTATTLASASNGTGSLAILQSGIYYIKGCFVVVGEDTIVLDKFSNNPSYNVGLKITETIVTADDDSTLNDNAIGTYNFNAPGANRYILDTVLTKVGLTDNIADFVTLFTVDNGILNDIVVKTDYSELEKTLARRTFDESGNYSVTAAKLDIRQHRNNNRGAWQRNTAYIIGDIISKTISGVTSAYVCTSVTTGISGGTEPTYVNDYTYFTDGGVQWEYTTTPNYNRGIYDTTTGGDPTKIALGLEGGKFYVNGFELEKHGTSYVNIDKPRTYQSTNGAIMDATIGYYMKATKLYGIPSAAFVSVDLYDTLTITGGSSAGTKVGTARIRNIEYDSGTIGIAGIYKVFLFDVQMNTGKSFILDVKQLYRANSGTVNFTADAYPTWTQISGTVTSNTTSITGTNTKFSSEIRNGDYISVNQATAVQMSAPVNDSSITGITITASTIPSNIYVMSNPIFDAGKIASYIYMPTSYVRSIRNSDDISVNTLYYITRHFGSSTISGTTITLTLTVAGEIFAPVANTTNYMVIYNGTGLPVDFTATADSTNTILTITGLTSGTYSVIGTVAKIAKERTKTSTVGTKTTTTQADAQNSTISLGVPDVYNILSIMVYPTSYTSISGTGIDITDNYILEYGIRETHYDISSVILKSGYFPPTGAVKIIYQYYAHGNGDYFSVDSYKNVVPYESIMGEQRDVLDFRPTITTDRTGFQGTNLGMFKRGYNISADYSYYLPRTDLVSIDQDGNYFVTKGVPSLTPKTPIENRQSMLLYTLSLEAYTIDVTPNSVNILTQDNKRYTMRDIGKLEKRIENLEYYTSLNLLEQQTKTLSIPDSKGKEKYKLGFLVDKFTDHGIGDVASLDYRCSIDTEKNELRPENSAKNVKLVEYNTTNSQRANDGYTITGDIITLPYEHIPMISQTIASRTSNINPFSVFTFIGSTSFTPSSDDWFEVQRLPDAIIQKEGNFTLTQDTLQATGVLGSVWGSWKQTWVGIETPKFTEKAGAAHGVVATFSDGSKSTMTNLGWQNNTRKKYPSKLADIQVQTKVTTDYTRSGVMTSVTATYDNQVIDDKIVSTSTIPYMRARNITFFARGLKLNTIFYPFFDGIKVSQYITPATKITITKNSGFSSTFDYTTNVGSDSIGSTRQIGGMVNDSLTKGDVINGSISNATAVVVLQENRLDNTIILHVLNVIGTFVTNDIITGSISKAKGTITNIALGNAGDTLVSNINGDVVGTFAVPNTDSIRFRTGEKEFILTTSATNGTDYDSIVRSIYHVSGILQTKQQTVESVRNAVIATERISENKTTYTTGTKNGNTWYDPLAQTFLVNQNGGAFITKVDIYFSTKDTTIPVRMQIRETVNGIPGKTILPFSEVMLTADQVNISSRVVVGNDGLLYNAPDTPTTFVFPSPVYVQNNVEYCVVLMSDSGQYNVWTAYAKDKKIDADGTIDSQPYNGVLFKSQNASTWTADDNQDLMFTIYRAQFVTNTTANVTFNNSALNADLLSSDPIQTVSGTTKVRVYHYNHGMRSGASVYITGISAAINGVPASEFLTKKTISNVDVDSYMIDVTTTPTSSGFGGGINVYATSNVKYDVLNANIGNMTFPETTFSTDIRTTAHADNTIDSYPSDIILGKDIIFATSRYIPSVVNQTDILSSKKGFALVAHLATTNDSISPVIDTTRSSMILVSNRINSIDNSYNINPFDIRTVSTSRVFTVDAAADTLYTNISAAVFELNSIVAGKYIYITGFTTNTAFNNVPVLVKNIVSDGTTSTTLYLGANLAAETNPTLTIKVGDYFVSDIVPNNSSTIAKYVSKIVTLDNPATSFKLLYSYNKPPECDIQIYYKTADSASVGNMKNTVYTLMSPNSTLISTTDYNALYDIQYDVSVNPFTAIVVKIVMKSTNSAKVPRLIDFRVIALA